MRDVRTITGLCAFLAVLFAVPSVAPSAELLSAADLVGTWRWESSTGGKSGATRDAGEFPTLQLEFASDGKLIVSRGGELPELEGRYELREESVGIQVLHLELDSDCVVGSLPPCPVQDFLVSLSGGELLLAERCIDCWRHTFPRDAPDLLPVLSTSLGELKLRWEDGPRP